jgi:CheY-like chemotaxis protein
MNNKQSVNPLDTFNHKEYSDGKILKITNHALVRILHIDDDLNQLLFTKIFLEEYDSKLSVESVSSPTKVMSVLKSGQFDCLVSDYQMDEMDGITLTKKVRKDSDIPIIIYTGRGSEEVESIVRESGADGYVQKETDPTHYKQLYAQIIRIIRGKNRIIKNRLNHPKKMG